MAPEVDKLHQGLPEEMVRPLQGPSLLLQVCASYNYRVDLVYTEGAIVIIYSWEERVHIGTVTDVEAPAVGQYLFIHLAQERVCGFFFFARAF